MSMEKNQTVNLLDSETEEEVTLVESLNSEEDNVDITGLTGKISFDQQQESLQERIIDSLA